MKTTMKTDRRTIILTTLICLLPVIAGIILYPRLPEQIATHWDAQGNVNGWSHRFTGAIVFPGILVLLNLAMPFLLRVDPKYENINEKIANLIQWIIPLVSIFCSTSTLAAALGKDARVETMGPLLVGVILVIIGNYLPKMRQSYTVGIKLPWTLNSEENWNRTHRVGGYTAVAAGILTLIGAWTPWAFPIITIGLIAMLLIPCVYSYLYYRRESAAGK